MRRMDKKNKAHAVTAGSTRIRRGFLWMPRTIQGQTRWLEGAMWEQIVIQGYGSFQPGGGRLYWVDHRWL